MALGFDMLAANLVLVARRAYKEYPIRLIAVIPFKDQSKNWSEKDQQTYIDIINRCDKQICLQDEYSTNSFEKRNQYLVDHTDMLIAAFHVQRSGSGQTYRKALKKGSYIVHFDTKEFTISYENRPPVIE